MEYGVNTNHADAVHVSSSLDVMDSGQSQEKPKPPLKVIDATDFCKMELPEREHVIFPILREKGLAMLFAFRGTGKTYLAHALAAAVATGSAVMNWKAPKARKVLIVDGEMPAKDLQDRLKSVHPEALKNIRILALDSQDLGESINLSNPEDQRRIEEQLGDTEFLILDNRSTLVSCGRENDAESWTAMQAWLLRLRRRGVAVLLLEHAGRNGEARGTSKREDVLDTVIQLKRPADYEMEDGARFEVHLTKARGVTGNDAAPFEAKLEIHNGMTIWSMKEMKDIEEERVAELTKAGLSCRSIAEELEISKSKVSKIQVRQGLEKRVSARPRP